MSSGLGAQLPREKETIATVAVRSILNVVFESGCKHKSASQTAKKTVLKECCFSHRLDLIGSCTERASAAMVCSRVPRVMVVDFSLVRLLVLFMTVIRPIFANSLSYEIKEELPTGTVVGNVKQDLARHANYSETLLPALRFRLRNGSADSFKIDAATGIIRIKNRIDRDSLCPFEDNCVINSDVIVESAQYYDIVAITYAIIDVNDNAPHFPLDVKVLEILETTSVGSAFILPSAEDLDSETFGVNHYRMAGDQDRFQLIGADTDELRLRLIKALDREMTSGYSMRIIAEDGGQPPRTAFLNLTVLVKDANDNPPRLLRENYEATVEENLPAGHRILQVEADDPDEGMNGNLTYSFTEDTLIPYGTLFQIQNDGWIVVKGVIDYERQKSLVLTVVISDQGTMALTSYARVIIYISDVNDNKPDIDINKIQGRRAAEVRENLSPGAFVSHIVVTDADGGDNGRVTCVIDNPRFQLVAISEGHSEYKLVSAEVFDREQRSQETVVISCHDRGGDAQSKSASRMIVVWIADDNDNTPKFLDDRMTVSVRENNANRSRIVLLNASDLDEGDNAKLDFRAEAIGDTPPSAVVIDEIGLLLANIVFDYEERQVYSYRIFASDRGTPSRSSYAQLDIRIEDLNDERPAFQVDSYVFRTRENMPVGTPIGTVRACSSSDGDCTTDNRNTGTYYSLVDGSPHLSINSRTGEITTKKVIDREEQATLKVQVRASNSRMHVLQSSAMGSSEVNVKLYIEDENDNSPVITFPNPTNRTLILPHWKDIRVGERVARVEAFDSDDGANANLTYAAVNETNGFSRYIGVEAGTGWITFTEWNTGDEDRFGEVVDIQLVIQVTDQGRPPRSATATLNMVVGGWVEPHAGDLLEGGSVILVVGVASGLLTCVVVVAIAVVCIRLHRCKIKNRHKYNCRLEANRATSNSSLNKFVNRKNMIPKPADTFAGKSSRGKKGVRFNLDDDQFLSISSPITDGKLSCPFPDECVFHRHDVPMTAKLMPLASIPSLDSLHKRLYPSSAYDHCVTGTNGNLYSPCPESSAVRHQHQPWQPIVSPIHQQRTPRKIDIPKIDHVLIKGNNDGAIPVRSSILHPMGDRSSSVLLRWSKGSLPDSGQGPSDEDDPTLHRDLQEAFYPAESKV